VSSKIQVASSNLVLPLKKKPGFKGFPWLGSNTVAWSRPIKQYSGPDTIGSCDMLGLKSMLENIDKPGWCGIVDRKT